MKLADGQSVCLSHTNARGLRFECLGRAFDRAETILATVLNKARFWECFGKVEFNDRQRHIVNRMLNGFEGKLTTSKWAKLVKCSDDTALRDIEDLIRKKVLVKDAAGGGAHRIR